MGCAVKLVLKGGKNNSLKSAKIIKKGWQKKQKKGQPPKKIADKKKKLAVAKHPAAKQPQQGFWPEKQPDLSYNLKSVKRGLYETSYYNCGAEKKAKQQDFYNPVLNSRGVDELVRAAKIKNDYLIDNYVNPFLREKFDSWKMLHQIDVQIRYVLEPYSTQRF